MEPPPRSALPDLDAPNSHRRASHKAHRPQRRSELSEHSARDNIARMGLVSPLFTNMGATRRSLPCRAFKEATWPLSLAVAAGEHRRSRRAGSHTVLRELFVLKRARSVYSTGVEGGGMGADWSPMPRCVPMPGTRRRRRTQSRRLAHDGPNLEAPLCLARTVLGSRDACPFSSHGPLSSVRPAGSRWMPVRCPYLPRRRGTPRYSSFSGRSERASGWGTGFVDAFFCPGCLAMRVASRDAVVRAVRLSCNLRIDWAPYSRSEFPAWFSSSSQFRNHII